MKEVSNQAQGNDNVAVAIDKYDNAMGHVAADTWKEKYSPLGLKGAVLDEHGTKCFGVPDLKIDGTDSKLSKGGCTPYTAEVEVHPGKPSPIESIQKPRVKPEIPADGGPKDPIKEWIKDPSLDGGIKKPFKPNVVDSIEFGEPFIKPIPKPGKVVQSSSDQSDSLEK